MGLRRDYRIYVRADAFLDVLEQGKRLPALYAQPGYWMRLFSAAQALVIEIPLPGEVTVIMANLTNKFGAFVGALIMAFATPEAQQVLHALPPTYQPYVQLLGALIAGYNLYRHPSNKGGGAAAVLLLLLWLPAVPAYAQTAATSGLSIVTGSVFVFPPAEAAQATPALLPSGAIDPAHVTVSRNTTLGVSPAAVEGVVWRFSDRFGAGGGFMQLKDADGKLHPATPAILGVLHSNGIDVTAGIILMNVSKFKLTPGAIVIAGADLTSFVGQALRPVPFVGAAVRLN